VHDNGWELLWFFVRVRRLFRFKQIWFCNICVLICFLRNFIHFCRIKIFSQLENKNHGFVEKIKNLRKTFFTFTYAFKSLDVKHLCGDEHTTYLFHICIVIATAVEVHSDCIISHLSALWGNKESSAILECQQLTCIKTVLHYNSITLQQYYITTALHYNSITLQQHYTTTVLHLLLNICALCYISINQIVCN